MKANPERDALADRLVAAQSAYVIAHIAPDADTLGAALGLTWGLRSLGKTVRVACADPVPMELRFMPGAEEFAPRAYDGEQIIVTCDVSDLQRIGSLYDEALFARVPVLNIDHHITNTRFGTLNWVSDVPATSEMVLELLQSHGIPISLDAATCLLAGIIGDTQCFITSNTAPSSLLAAATLQQMGAPLNHIATTVLNRKPFSALAVWRQALMTAHVEPGIIVASLSNEFLQQVGADDSSSNGLSSWLVGLDGIRVSAVMRETAAGTVDISMRSVPGINVAEVARQLGGGGHPQAAGCIIHGPLLEARNRLLEAVRPLARSAQDDGEPAG